jgi:hypothetical protein
MLDSLAERALCHGRMGRMLCGRCHKYHWMRSTMMAQLLPPRILPRDLPACCQTRASVTALTAATLTLVLRNYLCPRAYLMIITKNYCWERLRACSLHVIKSPAYVRHHHHHHHHHHQAVWRAAHLAAD